MVFPCREYCERQHMLQIFRHFCFCVATVKFLQSLRLFEIFLLNYCSAGLTELYPILIHYQPSKKQCEHWIMITNFRHELYFADSLGCKGYSFQQPALQTDDASTPTVSPKCMRLLYKICSFSSLQVSTRRNYRSSRC